MKCWRCGRENVQGTGSCIYCGASLSRPVPKTKEGRAMRELYDHYGPEEIFGNGAYLVNGLGDLLEDSKKLRNQLRMAADAGVLRLYREQVKTGASGPDFENKVRLLLTEDAGLGDKAALELIRCFDEMIGWETEKTKQESGGGNTGEKSREPCGNAGQTSGRTDAKASDENSGAEKTPGTSGGGKEAPGNKPGNIGNRNRAMLVNVILILAFCAAIYAVISIVTRQRKLSGTSSGSSYSFGQSAQTTQSTQPSPVTEASAGQSSSGPAPAAEEKETWSLTVTGGTILVKKDGAYEEAGTSCELQKGDYFKLSPDPDDNGYNFTGFTASQGSAERVSSITAIGEYRMPAEDVVFEAIFEPCLIIDWIPFLFNVDDYFRYDGKHALEMSKEELETVFSSAGSCYTEENGTMSNKYNDLIWWVSDKEDAHVDEATTFEAFLGVNTLKNTRSARWSTDELLPGSCPLRFGDSYETVCEKLGATGEMASELLSWEEEAKATNKEVNTRYKGADYQVMADLELKQDGRKVFSCWSKDYHYQFWFDGAGGLYSIYVSD